jgi:uncharacterized protein involved in exopolysaccharide biosynthesis
MPPLGTSDRANPVFDFNMEERINSEIELLKSRFLAEKVVQALGPLAIYPDLKKDKQVALRLSAANAGHPYHDASSSTSPQVGFSAIP